MYKNNLKEVSKLKGVLIIASITSVEEEPIVRKWLEGFEKTFGKCDELEALSRFLDNRLIRIADNLENKRSPVNYTNKLSSRLSLKKKIDNWMIRKKRLLKFY